MPRPQRTRTVIFRVTETEYDRLKLASAAAGARSLSDYMRSEVLNSINTDGGGMTVPGRFMAIDQKLQELHNVIGRLAESVSKVESGQSSRG